MNPAWSKPIQAFERFLRIGENLSEADRLRARVIYYTSLGYIALQAISLTSLMVFQNDVPFKRPLILLSCSVFIGAIFLLRYTKSKTVFGLFFGTMVIGIIFLAATRSPEALASFELGGGIHAPILPALCFGAVLVTILGNRATTLLYMIATAILIVSLLQLSGNVTTDPQLHIIGKVRAVQLGIFVLAICLISMALSQLTYSALNNLESTLGRAKRAEDARKELLATMSHEIRTPLNGIISVSDLLSKHKHAETTNTYLNIISLSAANLLEIVNESLGRARSDHLGDLDKVEISVRNDPFNPTEILQQTCDLFTALAEQKGLWIGTHGLESLPETLRGDAPHLRQIMSNLVSNSIKFTNKGGIRLGARRLDETSDGSVIQFFVQDTGVGIEDEALQTVFERFGQSTSAQSTKVDGTGLGLAICDDLVSAMGGTLDVHSTLGAGSTFSFTLTLPKTKSLPTEVAA